MLKKRDWRVGGISGRKPREKSREKNLSRCVQDRRSVMTIRSRKCVKGILDDALEVFNIVGICLQIYENNFLGMKIAEFWNFKGLLFKRGR